MINLKKILLISSVTFTLLNFALLPRVSAQEIPVIDYSEGKYKGKIPDWSRINFENLPAVQQPGFLKVPSKVVEKIGYDPSRSWVAGQRLDSIVKLGDVDEAFKISSLSLKDLSKVVPVSAGTLEDFGLIQWQTPQSLVKAIPQLGQLKVNEVKPLSDLFLQAGVSSRNISISQVLGRYPKVAKLPLSELSLSQYGMSSIPGIEKIPFKRFKQWQQSFINQVPGLKRLPFAQMPQSIKAGAGVVGINSVVFGTSERGDPRINNNYFVSGRVNRRGVTVPVACKPGSECSYLELGDFIAGQGLYGKRWASGSSQKVKGGFGILSKVNGGKEPTGRLVYGSGFKVVMTGAEESAGRADFGLFFRICAHIPFHGRSCTPYFIGPIPWIPVRENDLVILGIGR
ncbi:hypothetical protein [Mastigocoleus sp. MO_188.B34]|uniref:hypothetical protein n=1 Tax=Mastigocoleus sp. MO_188.B34 TaxID=3036635 RepID=UPI0026323E7E|nr:hypothetical protein [Mastigocoleus sp. MO_188.B34]MDJ0696930.1 hypothetical protein [Mastigocoleus sp. MO_188.B34]